jgi:DNA-binding GntR family transcriptional regulator
MAQPATSTAQIVEPAIEPTGKRQIHRQSLHAQAVDRLRDMIVEGELASGSRIVEAALCEALDISRTPLREALKVLAAEGLIELLPHRGARVTVVTAAEAGDLFEVIASLEGLAAELATSRMTAADLERLEALHLRMEQHHAARRRHDYFQLNHETHRLIVALSGNAVLAVTHERLLVRARRARYLAILSQERWDEAMREHHEIMVVFRARDSARAGALWRRHVQRTGEVVKRTLNPARGDGGRPPLYDD